MKSFWDTTAENGPMGGGAEQNKGEKCEVKELQQEDLYCKS